MVQEIIIVWKNKQKQPKERKIFCVERRRKEKRGEEIVKCKRPDQQKKRKGILVKVSKPLIMESWVLEMYTSPQSPLPKRKKKKIMVLQVYPNKISVSDYTAPGSPF